MQRASRFLRLCSEQAPKQAMETLLHKTGNIAVCGLFYKPKFTGNIGRIRNDVRRKLYFFPNNLQQADKKRTKTGKFSQIQRDILKRDLLPTCGKRLKTDKTDRVCCPNRTP
jgi:hypothetical protein